MNQQNIDFEKKVNELHKIVIQGTHPHAEAVERIQAGYALDNIRSMLLKERWENHLLYISNETSTQCSLKAERQRDALQKALNMAWNCIGFFASVIKSGERWTDTCQSTYNMAQQSEEEAKKVE